ncbi:MAG: tetratricopeptide repeat protein [Acidobacteriota bacterium]
MAFNREKVLRQAEKLVSKGKDRDAVAKYEEILANDPSDLNSKNKIGDLYLKIGDKTKATEAYASVANKYGDDGFTLRAIAMFKKCTRVDPTRMDFHEKLADLNAQQGLINEARSHYEMVAEHALQQGEGERARAIFAKITELDPDNLKTRLKLADLYLKDNQINLALGEYQVIGSELARKGMLEESLQVLEKALGLDPSNLQLLRSLSRTYAEMGQAERGLQFINDKLAERGGNDPELLVVLAETQQASGDPASATQTMQQAVQAGADRVDVRRAAFNLALTQGDVAGAVAHQEAVASQLLAEGKADEVLNDLRSLLAAAPGDVRVLTKLHEVQESSGADEKTRANTLSQLAEAHVGQADYPAAAGVLERLIELEPDASQHQEKLDFVKSKLGSGDAGGGAEAAAEGGFDADFEPGSAGDMSFGDLGDGDDGQSFGGMSFDDGELEEAAGVDDRQEFVSERVAEAEVFVKYGLVDKAIEQLVQIIDKYPDELPTRQRLKELYLEDQRSGDAVEQLAAIADILRGQGDTAGADEAIAQAREIDANHPALTGGGGGGGAAMELPAEPAAAASGFDFGNEPASGATGFDLGGGSETAAAPTLEGVGDVAVADLSLESPAAASAGGGEFELSMDEPAAAAQPEAGGSEFEISMDPAPAAEGAPSGGGEFELSMDEPAAAEPTAGGSEFEISMDPAPAAEGPPSGGGEFELSMDEPAPAAEPDAGAGEFELSMDAPASEPAAGGGEFELSMDAPASEPAAEPGLETMRLDSPASEPAAPAPAAEPAPAAPAAAADEPESEGLFGAEDDFFDFADELNKELDDEGDINDVSRDSDHSMSLEEIVAGMQKGVAEQVDAEDYETHYNLGIAYKEMGLTDEAIGEFQYASKSDVLFLQCCILLGACFTEKGMPELAIKWYEKGQEAPEVSTEDAMALAFEIGACQEAAGDEQKALESFMAIYAEDSRYRDIATRVESLKAKLGV